MITLTNIIYKYKDQEFNWGEFDCCIFTARIIEEYTGKKLPHWRKVVSYRNREDSIKALKRLGCKKGIIDLPSIILNKPKKPISEVKLGDPVYMVREDTGEGLLGVCNGSRAYFVKRPKGITARNIEDCEFCWSID